MPTRPVVRWYVVPLLLWSTGSDRERRLTFQWIRRGLN